MQKQAPVHPKNGGGLTVRQVRDLVEGWILDGEIRQLSARTLEERRHVTEKLMWFLNQREAAQCGTAEVRAFLAYATNGHKQPGGRWGNPKMTRAITARTVQAYYRTLHTLFAWVLEEGELERSPMHTLRPPKAQQDQVQPFSTAQMEALLTAARKSQHPRRNEAILLLLWDTGMRSAELCALQIADVDLTARRCRVHGKGNKVRVLPCGRRTTKALWNYRNEEPHETGSFFRADQGSLAGVALTTSGLGQLLERLGKAARLTGVRCSPHTVRHTFALDFLRAGGNQFTLMELLGHTHVSMTNRYVKLAQADIEAQHRQFSPVDRRGR